MKTRFGMMALVVAAVMGLSGCATKVTREKNISEFESGPGYMYMLAQGINRDLSKVNCDVQKFPETFSVAAADHWNHVICPRMSEMQLINGIYYTHPFKGIKIARAFAPSGMVIEKNDIVKISTLRNTDGTVDRPHYVVEVARRAKDATKESGCYWEGGAQFTNAFISGGVVCDGWDWKKQKFAQ